MIDTCLPRGKLKILQRCGSAKSQRTTQHTWQRTDAFHFGCYASSDGYWDFHMKRQLIKCGWGSSKQDTMRNQWVLDHVLQSSWLPSHSSSCSRHSYIVGNAEHDNVWQRMNGRNAKGYVMEACCVYAECDVEPQLSDRHVHDSP